MSVEFGSLPIKSYGNEDYVLVCSEGGDASRVLCEGFKGDRGETGPAGPAGPVGPAGPAGTPDSKAIFLAAHPVGEYWWTSTTVDPNTEYGGEWERVKDRFVFALGDTGSAGDTGGARTVALTEAQMPSHSHTGPSHTHGLNSHTHSIPAHSHGLNSHTHSIPSHSHGLNSHTHTMNHGHSLNMNGSPIVVNASSYAVKGGNGMGSGSLFQSFGVPNSPNVGNHTGSTGAATGSTASGGSGTSGGASGSTANSSSLTSGGASGSTASGGDGSTGTAGSGTAHENMPPYVAAYCWHRTA